MEPTQQYLNDIFLYVDGMILWKIKPCKRIKVGSRAGFSNTIVPYRRVMVNRVTYFEHRIIWTMVHGAIPDGMLIDHRDNNPSNNNVENLRISTRSNNLYNSRKSKANTSGFKGVYYHKKLLKWVASLKCNKKTVFLGSFDTPELAHEAFKLGAVKYHGVFSNFG